MIAASALADESSTGRDAKNEGFELVVHQPVLTFSPEDISRVCYNTITHLDDNFQTLSFNVTFSSEKVIDYYNAVMAHDGKAMAFTFNGKMVRALRGFKTTYDGYPVEELMDREFSLFIDSKAASITDVDMFYLAKALQPDERPVACPDDVQEEVAPVYQSIFHELWGK